MKGFCVWFSGIPSAGKTTLALLLKKRLEKEFGLPATLLDGDEIRENVTKGLGFSDKDRFENVTRVGWMASKVVEAGGIALVAMVSPAEDARLAAWKTIGRDKVLSIWVECSQEEAIKRDVKGLYAKAIRGEMKGLTGYDAPYELGIEFDNVINTNLSTANHCVGLLAGHLSQRGFLQPAATALFIGRWSPFHNGHKYIIDQALAEGKIVSIGVRRSRDAWNVKERMEMIQAVYPYVEVFPMVDIESVNIGRMVGYDVNRFEVPPEIHGISATEIRRLMSENNVSWRDKVPAEVAKYIDHE